MPIELVTPAWIYCGTGWERLCFVVFIVRLNCFLGVAVILIMSAGGMTDDLVGWGGGSVFLF